MKNTLCTILIALLPFVGMAQNIVGNEVPSCTSCDNNEVNLKKGASALGSQNISTGVNSFASGYLNQATGDYSVAMPYYAKSIGPRSLAFGYNARSLGSGSIAFGAHSLTGENGLLAIAIGSLVSADTNYSIVMGLGLADSPLINNKEKSLMIGFNSNIPTFYIGPSDGVGTFGNVGIGTTEPSELLEVNGNLKVNAHALITTANIDQLIVTGNTNFSNQDVSGVKRLIGYGNSLKLQNNGYGTAKITLAPDGNIGVGTSDPSHALEVDGDFSVNMQSWFQNNILQTAGYYIQSSQIKAPDATGLSLTNQSGDGLFVDDDGNVGIGTASPAPDHLLDVAGTLNTTGAATFGNDLKVDGNVSIGTPNPQSGYILTVNGKVISEDITVVENVGGADFVFADDYALPKLEDVESFIDKNNHLPDIPSAEEMKNNGVEVGKMQIKLLQKVEELTLYMIEQQKTIKKQQEEIEELKSMVEEKGK